MADGICDICHWRPATHTVVLTRNSRREQAELCDIDYVRMRSRQTAPLFDSLFGGGLFDMFGELQDFSRYASDTGFPLPREFRRQVKSELENELAREVLGGNIKEGSNLEVSYGRQGIIFKPAPRQAVGARRG